MTTSHSLSVVAQADARERARETVDCDDYRGHQSQHQWLGSRWVCNACDVTRDGRTLREKVGWEPPPPVLRSIPGGPAPAGPRAPDPEPDPEPRLW